MRGRYDAELPPFIYIVWHPGRPFILGISQQFPNVVVLNAVVCRNTQMSTKERKRKSAKDRKRAQRGAKERKRALPRKIPNNSQMETGLSGNSRNKIHSLRLEQCLLTASLRSVAVRTNFPTTHQAEAQPPRGCCGRPMSTPVDTPCWHANQANMIMWRGLTEGTSAINLNKSWRLVFTTTGVDTSGRSTGKKQY